MAASLSLVALAPGRVLRPPAAAGDSGPSCFRSAVARGPPLPRPPPRAALRPSSPATLPVMFGINVGSGWCTLPMGSIKRGFGMVLSAAEMDADPSDHVGEDDDNDFAHITNEKLRATLLKSKQVLATHRDVLKQCQKEEQRQTAGRLVSMACAWSGVWKGYGWRCRDGASTGRCGLRQRQAWFRGWLEAVDMEAALVGQVALDLVQVAGPSSIRRWGRTRGGASAAV